MSLLDNLSIIMLNLKIDPMISPLLTDKKNAPQMSASNDSKCAGILPVQNIDEKLD